MLKSVFISMIAFVLLVHTYTGTTNVVPGEADYPILSASPVNFVTVTFQIPTSVHVHFILVYAGVSGRGAYPKPSACHYAVRTGSETEYSVALHEYWKADPLNLTLRNRLSNEPGHSKDLRMYSASIPVDRYEAGRCHWQFDRLVYALEDDPSKEMPVFHYTNDVYGGTRNLFRFLCAKSDATREIPQREICGGPRVDFTGWRYQSLENRNAFLNDPQAYVESEAVVGGETVAIEFHDIDNVVPFPAPPILD
jgi:hypothetical protein